MFSTMPLPVFRDVPTLFRPAAPSPLSSSPLRATSPPLAQRDPNTIPRREVKSSPVRASKFKFASRPTRPVPIVQKREAAQEARRSLFLRNVRQRADDKAWERRGGDQELLKLEWWSWNREYQQAKDADVEGIVSENEIDDAAQLQPKESSVLVSQLSQHDEDEMMVDEIAQQEEAELDALISSQPQEPSSTYPRRPDSLYLSDDEDYDALFMDFLSQDDRQEGATSGDVLMS